MQTSSPPSVQGFRLSPQQKRLWLLQSTDPQPYRAQATISIHGKLQLPLLESALRQVISRHEILRTVFVALPEMDLPLQAIAAPALPAIPILDLSCLAAADQTAKVAALQAELHQNPRDWEQGPLLEAMLVKRSPAHHQLLLDLPALCADSRTLQMLFDQISQAYAAQAHGQVLEDEPLQYVDLAEWQNELFDSEEAEVGRTFWRRRQFPNLGLLQLPFAHAPTPLAEFTPRCEVLRLPAASVSPLHQLAQQSTTSVETLLLALWKVLLWRLTGDASTIGVGCDGRNYEELETALGPFAKYVPVFTPLELKQSFLQVSQQVHFAVHEGEKWQETFSWDEINFSEDCPGFFPICFDYETLSAPVNAADLSFQLDQQSICCDRFQIKLGVTATPTDLIAAFHYDAQLCSREAIQRLVAQFQTLLASAIAAPNAAISQLNLLTAGDRRQLLVDFNPPASEAAPDGCIHQWFEAQVEQTPDYVAVVYEDQQLTYAQLNAKANQLAHFLQRQGVESETLVGLCVERSLDFILGLLGILKAGGAYLPLDPTLPTAALAFRVQQAQLEIVVTQPILADQLSQSSVQPVYVDDAKQVAESTDNPSDIATPNNLAYVLFTSGSTGQPKGVGIEHRQVIHYLHGILPQLHLSPGASFAHVSTFAADLGNTILFAALCTGGCLHLLSQSRLMDPALLAEYCRRHPIEVLKIAPSHLKALMDTAAPTALLPRHCLILGGETVTWDLVNRIRQFSPCRLLNHYGPTEATVGVLTHPIEGQSSDAATVPLGQPLPQAQIYLLDHCQQLVPVGVVGELYIGGAQLARGYQHRPDLTSERFIPNPFSAEPGARLYRTGDLARHLPDGRLEFLGRVDDQVKIRGFRVELGEIEALLRQHPEVQEAVVLARPDEAGALRLAAYVVAEGAAPVDVGSLRAFLQQRSPDYMLPTAFALLESLPLTPNGKIDRQTLLATEAAASTSLAAEYTAPRTAIEELIVQIWSQLLQVQSISTQANFFELGGHSLLAIQVISRLRQAFGVDLPLQELFDQPTVSGLAMCLETALQQGLAVAPPIKAGQFWEWEGDRSQAIPLSFAQQRLWFFDQLEPNNIAYTIPIAVRLQGELDGAALERSLHEIARRHAVWRTAFAAVDGEPVQAITPEVALNLPVVDLQRLPFATRETTAKQKIAEQLQQPFDLGQSPLLRTLLVRLDPAEHILLLTTHHIIFDAWSRGILVRELATLYTAFSSGQPSPLPALPIQYADYAIWQRQWLQGEALEAQLAYWRQQLADAPTLLDLPTDYPRPAVQTFRGGKHTFTLSTQLTRSLKQLSQQEAVTLFMTLLAAFQTLLHRYTGQTDLLIGSPVLNRNRAEVEGLLGFFTNTLVLRTDLSGNPSFLGLLRRVRSVALQAYSHQELPFEKLVDSLPLERNLSHHPLFQVMFTLRNTPPVELQLPGLQLTSLETDNATAKFDLTLMFEEDGAELKGLLEYNADLFEPDTIQRLAKHLQVLLEAIACQPDQRLSELPLLTPAECQQLQQWNHTHSEVPLHCLHTLIEAQVERTPAAIALRYDNQTLSYQQLNTQANQLAHYLQRQGIPPDTPVGLCLERSPQMLVALLAILKAGGAYLPLDPALPAARLAWMLHDAQVPLLLTHSQLQPTLPDCPATQVMCLDHLEPALAIEPTTKPLAATTPRHLAYVIYTSGSTGQPKGVQIPHAALVNVLTSMQRRPGLCSEDILLAVTTLSFDIAALELFLPLLAGAQLVMASREVAADGVKLAQALQHSEATIMQATPATWQMLLTAGWSGNPALKVLCGGEALPLPLAHELSARCASLWNLYGPTEATIWSAAIQVEADSETVPLGLPIANTQFYVLDAYEQVVPVGVPGELHIGGQGLARGYRHRAALTAERFIPNPFAQQPGERLYKTGDLVRCRADGSLEFLGRLDHQVKLRGHRIELGEIEAVLQSHEWIQQAVVQVAQERLVAYVAPADSIPAKEAASLASTLQPFLQQRLPAYMTPTAFVTLESFPLTPNGKIDRQKLPQPNQQQPTSDFIAARSPIEEVLSGIWAQVLGLEQVSIHDDFFELGGHSLLATQVISQLRAALQVEIPLRSLFAHPTIAVLAAQVACAQRENHSPQPDAIQPVPRDRLLPLSFAQQRLWFLDQLQPGNAAYIIPMAARLSGHLDFNALQQSLDALVQRQEGLRTRFTIANGHPVQVVESPTPFSFTVESLESLSPSQQQIAIQQRVTEAAHQPFDLTQAPLWRLVLLQLAEAEHVAIFTLHHTIADGWSIGVLVRELAALYTACVTGQPHSLPLLPIQYADFAVWQHQRLQGEILNQQLTYWRQRLAGSQPMVLKSDRPRPASPNLQGGTEPFHLSAAVTAQLRSLSRTADATLFMTLLAGFNVLLARYSQREDIVVGTDVANRNRAELEGVIGFFVNLLVLRTDLSDNPRFTTLLKRVREVCLDAYAHQDLPFSKLVEAMSLERQSSETPLFQVLFVLQNVPTATIQLPDLALTPIDVNNGMAKFDLALFLHETEEELVGAWRYRTDLFDAATIQRLSRQLETLFSQVASQPTTRIQSLDLLSEIERTHQTMTNLKHAERKFDRFKHIKPKAVSLTQRSLIQTSRLQPDQSLPLVVQPSSDDTDLIDWAIHHRDWINQHLYQHGAILFRSRQIETVETFEQFAQGISPSLFGEYGDLPRVSVGGNVYSSTPYPADRAILFHNESSHLSCYPMKIWFYCIQPAQAGGETPIVDGRQVYQQLAPELRATFAEKGLMYVRNFVEGLDVSWRQFFQTDDRAKVETHCRQSGITWEWTDTGLRTCQIRPAITTHPKTGDCVWFNQLLLHHMACLDAPVRQSMLDSLGAANLPRHVYYGDGTPIPDAVVEAIQTAFAQAKIAFPWQMGDVLLLDNILTAHGRNPYEGSRQIVVAMGEMVSNSAVNPRGA